MLEPVVERVARVWARAGERSPPGEDAMAIYAVLLALTPNGWVKRRNEAFSFVDGDTVRRRMSVDFALPADDRFQAGDTVLVPLMLLDKVPLRNFDVRDAEDRPISLLTTEENARVVQRGVGLLLASHLRIVPTADLAAVIGAPTPEDGRVAAAAALAERPRKGPLRVALDALPEPDLRDTVAALLSEVALGFVALVPFEYRPGVRQVVKISYDASLHPREAPLRTRAYLAGLRVLASFGLIGRRETFTELAVGHAGSYHCEVVPPADAYVAHAELHVKRYDGTEEVRTDDHLFRPHMYATAHSRGDAGSLRIVIHAHREGLLLPLWGTAVLLAAALLAVRHRLQEADAQTVGAMVLIPFALAAYYVRDENGYVTVMLRAVRLTAAVPVLAGIVVIGMLALGFIADAPRAVDPDAVRVAEFAAWGSLGAAVLLTCALLAPAAGRWPGRSAVAVGLAVLVVRYGFGVELPVLG